MVEKIVPGLGQVPETLLLTLYIRAVESRRPDALLRDPGAEALAARLDYNFHRTRLHGHDQTAVILRALQLDRIVAGFLARHPAGPVVYIGCGLDTRFERVDNGVVEWYDLDLPEVIDLRRKLIAADHPRCHVLSASALEAGWMDAVLAPVGQPCLFLAEGVLPYFEETDVRRLVLRLGAHFPGAELAFDGLTPFVVWADNLQLAHSGIQARMHWGLRKPADLEAWGAGIRLLDEWYYFDQQSPRLKAYNWARWVRPIAHSAGVFHYQLGGRG